VVKRSRIAGIHAAADRLPTSESRESTTFRSCDPIGQRIVYEYSYIRLRRNAGMLTVAQVLGAKLGRRRSSGSGSPAGLLWSCAEPGGDDRDLDLALHGVVAPRREDDVGAGSAADRTISAAFCTSAGDVLAGGDVNRMPLRRRSTFPAAAETACLAASSSRESPAPWRCPERLAGISMIAFTSASRGDGRPAG